MRAQNTIQRRYDPSCRQAAGATSWNTEPASSGRVVISPAAISPFPAASAKAGR